MKISGRLERILKQPLLTDTVHGVAHRHQIDSWGYLAKILDVRFEATPPWIVPSTPPEELTPFLDHQRVAHRKVWIIHPGARTEAKRWPEENFLRVVNEVLLPDGDAVIWINEDLQSVTEQHNERFCSIRTPTIASLFGTLQSGTHYLGNDSFPAHAAAACGLKVYTVFTSANPDIFAPYGHRQRTIEHDVCEFRPCLDHCLKPSFICRDVVTVELVTKKILADKNENASCA